MKFITWNMQGATGFGESKWNTDVKRLFIQGGADLVCLQECGVPPPTAIPVPVPPAPPPPVLPPRPPWLAGFAPPAFGVNGNFFVWNLGTTSRPAIVYILWIQCDPPPPLGANRNNLAVVSKVIPTNLIYVAPPAMGGRPAVGIRVPFGLGAVNFFTLHAFSGGGGNAPGLLANLNAAGAPWFAAGDYNRDPSTWTPFMVPAGTVFCGHGEVTTHPGSGTNLDYAFKNPGPVVEGTVLSNFVVSDHYPVGYVL